MTRSLPFEANWYVEMAIYVSYVEAILLTQTFDRGLGVSYRRRTDINLCCRCSLSFANAVFNRANVVIR